MEGEFIRNHWKYNNFKVYVLLFPETATGTQRETERDRGRTKAIFSDKTFQAGTKLPAIQLIFKPFVPNASFLYPLKTPENRRIF